jgi:hypothetical protein
MTLRSKRSTLSRSNAPTAVDRKPLRGKRARLAHDKKRLSHNLGRRSANAKPTDENPTTTPSMTKTLSRHNG